MTFTDLAKSHVRTVVPYLVGLVVAVAARHGVKLDAQETAALTVVVGSVYFAAARLLERYVSPRFGWLLGLAQQPVYAKVTTRKDAPNPLFYFGNNTASFTTSPAGYSACASYNLTDGTGATVGSVVANPSLGLDYRVPLATVHDRLPLLPPPSGRKHGAIPSPRDDRDYPAKLPRLSSIPTHVDNGLGLIFAMLLNDRIGDCYPAALLHALQVLLGYTPTDADVLTVYEAMGYDPTKTDANGNNPTDRGTAGRTLFGWARSKGLIVSYAAVPANRAAVKAAIAAHKVVLCEWALPVGAESEGARWTMPRANKAAGSWGYHATVEVGYTPRHNDNVTWGEEGSVTPPFEDAYLQAAWVIEVAPGTNVAAIMAKVRAA